MSQMKHHFLKVSLDLRPFRDIHVLSRSGRTVFRYFPTLFHSVLKVLKCGEDFRKVSNLMESLRPEG